MDAALLLIVDRGSAFAARLARPPSFAERFPGRWISEGRDKLGVIAYVESAAPDWLWKYLPSELRASSCRTIEISDASVTKMWHEALRAAGDKDECEWQTEPPPQILPWLVEVLESEPRWCVALLWESENAALKREMSPTETVNLLASELANVTPRRGFIAFRRATGQPDREELPDRG